MGDDDMDNDYMPARRVDRGELYWVAPDATRGSVPGYPHPPSSCRTTCSTIRASTPWSSAP